MSLKISELSLENVDGRVCVVSRNKRGNIKHKVDVNHRFLELTLSLDNKMWEQNKDSIWFYAIRKADREQLANIRSIAKTKNTKDLKGYPFMVWMQTVLKGIYRHV